MSFASFSREFLPAIEAEMRDVVDGVQGLPADSAYRTLVEVKLTALGVDVAALKSPTEGAKP